MLSSVFLRVAQLFDIVKQRALGLEYHWQPESSRVRGNLADRHYISMVGKGFDFPDGSVGDWETIENTGTTEHWTKRWSFTSSLSRAELYALLAPTVVASWRQSAAPADSVWEFEDDQVQPWTAEFTLDGAGNGEWTLRLQIDRR